MTFLYHPEFPQEIKKFEFQYKETSASLGQRFRAEVDGAIEHIKKSPTSAGPFP
jgi:hypothetical protein